ncbi:hypothetical protein BC831DRAFT_479817 [Entophlyctis helioformis]|nr:hypothetical protein BC831DRAFT_479817 [Entophlyctis helioformis]
MCDRSGSGPADGPAPTLRQAASAQSLSAGEARSTAAKATRLGRSRSLTRSALSLASLSRSLSFTKRSSASSGPAPSGPAPTAPTAPTAPSAEPPIGTAQSLPLSATSTTPAPAHKTSAPPAAAAQTQPPQPIHRASAPTPAPVAASTSAASSLASPPSPTRLSSMLPAIVLTSSNDALSGLHLHNSANTTCESSSSPNSTAPPSPSPSPSPSSAAAATAQTSAHQAHVVHNISLAIVNPRLVDSGLNPAHSLSRFSSTSQANASSSNRNSVISTTTSEFFMDDSRDSIATVTSPSQLHVDTSIPSSKPAVSKRERIFREILETERRYVDSLVLLHDVFYEPLRVLCGMPGEILTKKQVSDIFSNLKDILNVNREIKRQLERRAEAAFFDPETTCIGDIFFELAPYLRVYSIYARNFNYAIALSTDLLARNQLFAGFVRDQSRKPECKGLQFQAFLLEPVQRIPRYKLFLKELLERMPEEHPDKANTRKAMDIVSQVATFVNEEIRKHENVLKMIELQRGLIGLHESLLTPGRRFLYRGRVQKISRKHHQPRELILFSDILVYASPIILDDQLRFHRKLHLDNCRVEGLNDSETIRNAFQIITREKSFVVYAESAELKQEWLSQLTSAISELKDARKTLRTPNTPDVDNIEGYKAPIWVPDSLANNCNVCTTEFTLFNRKHHCRACGNVVCSSCSTNAFYVPLADHDQLERCCDVCFQDIVASGKFRVHVPNPRASSDVSGSSMDRDGDDDREPLPRGGLGVTLPRASRRVHIVSGTSSESPLSPNGISSWSSRVGVAALFQSAMSMISPPRSCSLCQEPFTYLKRMNTCTTCERHTCTDCMSRQSKTQCDPCSHGIKPEDVIVSDKGGGWSLRLSDFPEPSHSDRSTE